MAMFLSFYLEHFLAVFLLSHHCYCLNFAFVHIISSFNDVHGINTFVMCNMTSRPIVATETSILNLVGALIQKQSALIRLIS